MEHNLLIHANNIELTPALHDYIQEKISKIWTIMPGITSAKVILDVTHLDHKAEATVHLGNTHGDIFAEAITDDLYKSIDKLEDKLVTQLKKQLDKMHNHHKGESEG